MPPLPHEMPTPQVPRQYMCRRATMAPTIDGRVEKAFWREAPWTEEFLDIEGDARPRPRYRTRAKMLWDDRCLYVAAALEEPHVWATLTERDSIVFHDNDFEVFLNPTGDNHRYYEVEINARNTIFDLFLSKPYRDGGPADHAWDAKGMITAVHIEGTLNDPSDVDEGWSVEMAIPWAALDRHDGSRPREGDQWRVNFSRVQWDVDVTRGKYEKIPGRPEHNWVWSPQGIIDMHRPERWGYVQFVGAGGSEGGQFRPDPTAATREMLHRIYYAQARHKAETGVWASTLGLPCGVKLEVTGDEWRAAVPLASGGRMWIRQDSLVWIERE